jgi:DNA (cytosine-5)-methyltransferase 1
MENVPGAPMSGYSAVLCGLMFGLRVIRHRLFESSVLLLTPPHPRHPKGDLTGSCKGYSTGANGYVTVAGNNFVREAGAKAMGIDWMTTRRELANAIPPAYTEFVGRQLLAALDAGNAG